MQPALVLLGVACLGCGAPTHVPPPAPPGTLHAAETEKITEPTAAAPDGGVAQAPLPMVAPAAQPEGPTTFELKNAGEGELLFAIWHGWQPIIFAYTGKPPNAKAAQIFPKFCTAACVDKACPVCPEPQTPRERKKAEKEAKKEIVQKGNSVKVPWDGKLLEYAKLKDGKRTCECWRRVDPSPAEYTIKACGLRAAGAVGKASKQVCVETQLTLPVAPASTVTLSFDK